MSTEATSAAVKQSITYSKYISIHRWVLHNYGRATYCSFPDCTGKSKIFDWALKKGHLYDRNIDNYIPLCRSCHQKYDDTVEARINKSSAHIGINNHGKDVAIFQKDKSGRIIAEHFCIAEAVRKTDILGTAINNCLANRSKTAGGFIWEYITPEIKINDRSI